jgi:hypothetical protein
MDELFPKLAPGNACSQTRDQTLPLIHPAVPDALSAIACSGDFPHLRQRLSLFHVVLEKTFNCSLWSGKLDGTVSIEHFNMEVIVA